MIALWMAQPGQWVFQFFRLLVRSQPFINGSRCTASNRPTGLSVHLDFWRIKLHTNAGSVDTNDLCSCSPYSFRIAKTETKQETKLMQKPYDAEKVGKSGCFEACLRFSNVRPARGRISSNCRADAIIELINQNFVPGHPAGT